MYLVCMFIHTFETPLQSKEAKRNDEIMAVPDKGGYPSPQNVQAKGIVTARRRVRRMLRQPYSHISKGNVTPPQLIMTQKNRVIRREKRIDAPWSSSTYSPLLLLVHRNGPFIKILPRNDH